MSSSDVFDGTGFPILDQKIEKTITDFMEAVIIETQTIMISAADDATCKAAGDRLHDRLNTMIDEYRKIGNTIAEIRDTLSALNKK